MNPSATSVAPRGRALVVVTWFLRSDTALEYWVGEDGTAWDCRDVHLWAVRDSHTRTLDRATTDELAAAIAALPAASQTPPVGHPVMVSRVAGGAWRTDAYDADDLPPAMERVMSVVGERFETRDRKRRMAP